LEHRELMAQDEDFDVLGSVSAESQRHLRLQLCEHLVDQLRRYLRIMSGWLGLRCSRSTAVSTISGTNRSGWPAEADPVAKVVGNDRWQRDGHPARAQHVQIVDAVRRRAYPGDHARQLRRRVGAPDLIRAVVIDAFSARTAAAGSCSASPSRGTSPT